jgi:hypothetical protein
MSILREVHADAWRVRLDMSRQVLRLEVPEFYWHHGGRRPAETPLLPTLPLTLDGPVSAATLLLKAKQFDDGLYAAVDLAAQHGAGRFAGKATLLRSLAATLAGGLPETGMGGATVIHAACAMGGLPIPVPAAVTEAVRAARAGFFLDERLSKPLGFYTWTPELTAIFHQDRFLQLPLDTGPADDLARAVELTPGASDTYHAWLRLNARLTNPPNALTLWDAGKRPAFLPSSRSREVTLFQKLFEDQPIPNGFDLMAELIRRVRAGQVSLKPTDSSGWYDHQTWALESLIAPDRVAERNRLELGQRYRKYLEDLFRGALALTRETHIKQVRGGFGGGCGRMWEQPIWVGPDLALEPLPSLYARRATSYRFVRLVLEEAFGVEALGRLHRLTPEGPTSIGLAEELAWIENLFAGAAATANRNVGMPPGDDDETTVPCFTAWRAKLGTDQDVGRDARMMVPVFYDVVRKQMKV